ncbi:hypothetical protein [Solihabitans fulvus]|uniref:hypothetical protein n=1 Tax=Solihabitans fulvus TaxID=1892852 RepID=UPI001661CE96|nr:hypothetical protein [Solihabitans fulvus]
MRWLGYGLVSLVLLLAAPLTSPGSAEAHGISSTADVQLAQTFAGNELTVVLRRAPLVPGPLTVDVIAHDPVRSVGIDLTATALEGMPAANPAGNRATLRLTAGRPGVYTTALRVDRPGQWQLDLRAQDGEKAVLPFRVLVPRAAAWELVVYPGFALAGVFMVGALVAAVLRRRWLGTAAAGGAVVALAVGLTAALLSSAIPAALPDGAAPTIANNPADGFAAGGRPYVNLTLGTEPAQPVAGVEFTLRLRLSDGATGQPIDDLVSHHAALAHTVVTSQDCTFFRHIHPVLTAPGVLEVRLTVDRPGRYLVHTEFERADSGGQLVTGSFEAGGTATATPLAPSTAEQPQTELVTSPARPVAGEPTELRLQVTVAGRPARDLQPWLGMAGHLIVRDPRGDFFGHVHEMDSMAAQSTPGVPVPDETVAQYGPTLRFTFTFPSPGRYPVWIQYARDFQVHTVALSIDVGQEQQ